MSILHRAARAASAIVERRVAPESTIRESETLARILVAEGYAAGYLDGLARARDEITSLQDTIRRELEEAQ